MDAISLLLIEQHMQSTLLDKLFVVHHEQRLSEIAVMPDLNFEKQIKTLQIYSHSYKESPVLFIFGTNSNNVSSLACIHHFYPFGFIKLPSSNKNNYSLNQPPLATYGCYSHTDHTIISPTKKEYEFMLNLYQYLKRNKIPVLMISLHMYSNIYGYNPIDKYVKITYLNPFDRFKLWSLLAKSYLCFNFHFHNTDVFMREYDLQGCNYVHFNHVEYKRKIDLRKDWLELNLSTCESTLTNEYDAIVSDVFYKTVEYELYSTNPMDDLLNKDWIERNWNIPSVKALWHDEYERRQKLHINNKLSQESVRSIDKKVKTGIFDQNINEENCFHYPEWEQNYRKTIDQLILQSNTPTSTIIKDYEYAAVNRCASNCFSVIIEHLNQNYDGLRLTIDEEQLIDMMVYTDDEQDSLNSLLSSDSDSDVILQVDGGSTPRKVKPIIPKSSPIKFKQLNVTPTKAFHKKTLLSPFSRRTASPPSILDVTSPTKSTNNYKYSLSPPLFNVSKLTSCSLNVPTVQPIGNKWIYLKSPPLFKRSTKTTKKVIIDEPITLVTMPCKLLCIEILAETKKSFYNPTTDKITCIAYGLQKNWQEYCYKCDVLINEDELSLLYQLIDLIKEFEPDILLGWDIHNSSIGYVIKRCMVYNIDFLHAISRLNKKKDTSKWLETHTSAFSTYGRLFLNAWRICKNNLDLRLYTIEATYNKLFNSSFPIINPQQLTLNDFSINYIKRKCQTVLQILDKIDFICQTMEFSSLYGIPFESVLTRGSQYRVESVLYRICKKYNYLLASPTKEQVNSQSAAEFIPLVMEPKSNFYSEPISVVDFQSLYPSLMIANNLCFSTLICKINTTIVSKQLGCFDYQFDLGLLSHFYKNLNIAPNGAVFVDSSVKQGILPMLVTDLLDTRQMIKTSMKCYKNEKIIRLLNARQLALKLLANVIYGYASASFSGRMPMVEVADAIVSLGRFTLQTSKQFIESHYPVTIRYGDTDSLFIECTNYSTYGALQVSHSIVSQITKLNPFPMKLKFEKLYLKCFLLTKKRYCGFKIEKYTDIPEFEGKGIETVRRDGCLLSSHLLKESLLFYFKNQTKLVFASFIFNCFNAIHTYPLYYFIIAKEVRVGTYKQLPPGAIVAERQMEEEPGFESQYGYRQPYLVIYNSDKLKENVVSPSEFLKNKNYILNSKYYIEKQLIPVFERIFQFTNIDMTKIRNQLHYRTKNDRFNEQLDFNSCFQLNQMCNTCMNQSYMRLDALECSTYICSVFDAKLKLKGEWF